MAPKEGGRSGGGGGGGGGGNGGDDCGCCNDGGGCGSGSSDVAVDYNSITPHIIHHAFFPESLTNYYYEYKLFPSKVQNFDRST